MRDVFEFRKILYLKHLNTYSLCMENGIERVANV